MPIPSAHSRGRRSLWSLSRLTHLSYNAASFKDDLIAGITVFEDALLQLEQDHPQVTHILIKSSGINGLDASGVDMLGNLVTRFRDNGITLVFSGFKRQVQEVIERTGLAEQIGRDQIFATDREAIDRLLRILA